MSTFAHTNNSASLYPAGTPVWIGYKFPKQTAIKFMILGLGTNLNNECGIKNATLQGSDDDFTTFDNLKTGVDVQGSSAVKYLSVPVEGNSQSYRLYTTESYYDSGQRSVIVLSMIQFYGFDYSEKEFAPNSNRLEIYDHGVELMELETSVTGSASVTKESNQILCHLVTGGNNTYLVTNKTALTIDNDYLFMHVGNRLYRSDSANVSGRLRILDEKIYTYSDTSHVKGSADIPKQSAELTYSLDISAFKQSQMYVGFSDGTSGVNTDFTFTELWLE
jgi:hypothetical protein